MLKRKRSSIIPALAAGLSGLALASCATYGAGDYGYSGRSYPSYGYGAPYGYGRGAIYAAPRTYDRAYHSGYGRYGSRGYSAGHTGFGHLGGRRH